MSNYKYCRRCGNYGDFYKNSSTADGLQTYCRICQTELARTWQKNNTRRFYTSVKKRRYQRLDSDLNFRLASNIRIALNVACQEGWTKGKRVEALGCSIPFFKSYIESLFIPPMTWENHGPLWQFDHIKTLSSFDLSDPIQFNQACNYKNVQPLLKIDHYRKTRNDNVQKIRVQLRSTANSSISTVLQFQEEKVG